jgi:hypothetical protein
LNPLANAVGTEVFGNHWRWREALPLVKKRLEEEAKPATHQLIEETESDEKPRARVRQPARAEWRHLAGEYL